MNTINRSTALKVSDDSCQLDSLIHANKYTHLSTHTSNRLQSKPRPAHYETIQTFACQGLTFEGQFIQYLAQGDFDKVSPIPRTADDLAGLLPSQGCLKPLETLHYNERSAKLLTFCDKGTTCLWSFTVRNKAKQIITLKPTIPTSSCTMKWQTN